MARDWKGLVNETAAELMLKHVAREGSVKVQEVAERLGIHEQRTRKILERLEDESFLRIQEPGSEESRAVFGTQEFQKTLQRAEMLREEKDKDEKKLEEHLDDLRQSCVEVRSELEEMDNNLRQGTREEEVAEELEVLENVLTTLEDAYDREEESGFEPIALIAEAERSLQEVEHTTTEFETWLDEGDRIERNMKALRKLEEVLDVRRESSDSSSGFSEVLSSARSSLRQIAS